MGRHDSVKGASITLLLTTIFLLPYTSFLEQAQAVTASQGQPYHGRLQNGIPFPNQFPGYRLRDGSNNYTTPEVVGALLDGIEAVRTEFPDTCDLFIGDFSGPTGGSISHHRSHQNGRDVDVGMYFKGNRPMDTFAHMNEENLDAPKTWCLLESIIRSQRVQYIFLDRRVQKILYDHAVTKGYDAAYLDRVFGNVQGSLIQHVRNHSDHMHIRFFSPWSTLASHIGDGEDQKRMVVEMAQQAYLPKRVNYYVNGSEKSLDALAKSFGVTRRDLCKWNQIASNSVLAPGSCLVFYKRGFEIEPVHLAQSLQPGFIAEAPPIRTASLQAQIPSVSDADESAPEPRVTEKRAAPALSLSPAQSTISARRGDTLESIAKRSHVDVKVLCQLNGMKKTASLKAGQTIKLAAAKPAPTSARSGSARTSNISFGSDPKKPNEPTIAYYTASRGDTLPRIAKKSGISLNSLCQMNGLSKNSAIKPGQKIKLTQVAMPSKSASSATVQQKATASAPPASHAASVSKTKGAAAPAPLKAKQGASKSSKAAEGAKDLKAATSKKIVRPEVSKERAGASKGASNTVKQPQNAKSKVEPKAVDSKAGKASASSAKTASTSARAASGNAGSKTPVPKTARDAKAAKSKTTAPLKAGAREASAREPIARLARK